MIIRFLNTLTKASFEVSSKVGYMEAVHAAANDARATAEGLTCVLKLPESMGGWAPVSGLQVPLSYWGGRTRLARDWGYLCWYGALITDIEVALWEQAPLRPSGDKSSPKSAQIVALPGIQSYLF